MTPAAASTVVVRIPGLLRSYTAGAASVSIATRDATTVDDVLRELDARYPGFRFRIIDEQHNVRRHIKVFADAELVQDLSTRVNGAREMMIVGALSGG